MQTTIENWLALPHGLWLEDETKRTGSDVNGNNCNCHDEYSFTYTLFPALARVATLQTFSCIPLSSFFFPSYINLIYALCVCVQVYHRPYVRLLLFLLFFRQLTRSAATAQLLNSTVCSKNVMRWSVSTYTEYAISTFHFIHCSLLFSSSFIRVLSKDQI